MIATSVCCSLEAEKIEIQARKFLMQTPRRDSKLNKLVYPFKVSIFGIARVSQVYPDDQGLYRECSMRCEGDELRGETLDGFATKPIGKQRVAKATASHKATFVDCRGGVYAHIEIGPRHLLAASNKPAMIASG